MFSTQDGAPPVTGSHRAPGTLPIESWLLVGKTRQQMMLINHYGLNLMDPQARGFLTKNMEAFLFKTGGEEDVDTTKKGTITW